MICIFMVFGVWRFGALDWVAYHDNTISCLLNNSVSLILKVVFDMCLPMRRYCE